MTKLEPAHPKISADKTRRNTFCSPLALRLYEMSQAWWPPSGFHKKKVCERSGDKAAEGRAGRRDQGPANRTWQGPRSSSNWSKSSRKLNSPKPTFRLVLLTLPYLMRARDWTWCLEHVRQLCLSLKYLPSSQTFLFRKYFLVSIQSNAFLKDSYVCI